MGEVDEEGFLDVVVVVGDELKIHSLISINCNLTI